MTITTLTPFLFVCDSCGRAYDLLALDLPAAVLRIRGLRWAVEQRTVIGSEQPVYDTVTCRDCLERTTMPEDLWGQGDVAMATQADEADIEARYGQTIQELADEAERGYDVNKMRKT